MKNILTILTLLILSLNLMAQSPDKISYQAVVRNGNNTLVTNQQIGLKVSVLQGSVTGTSVYAETHTPTTNANGLLTVEIGAGTMLTDSFNKINWANGPYFIKTEIDPNGGNNYSITGTTQLLSVPYALHARTADSIVGAKSFSGNYNDLTNKPITISNIVGDTFKLSNGGYIVSATTSNHLSTYTVNTNISAITSNSAILSGIINVQTGFEQIIERGFVLDNKPNPNLYNAGKFVVTDTAFLVDEDVWLQPGTTYYVKSYLITEGNRHIYGNQVSFTTNSVGQQGPAGGIVFYDKGDTIGGWRYLEAAPTDQSSEIQWGCANANAIATDTKIGSGVANTLMIVNSCNDTSFAAKLCNDLVLGGKSDWFLPSSVELRLMIMSLLSSFSMGEFYWSSSDSGSNSNAFYAFRTGTFLPHIGSASKSELLKVRAIRRF